MATVVLFDAIPTGWVSNISQRPNIFVDFLLQRRWASKNHKTLRSWHILKNAGNIMIRRKSAKLSFHHVARKKCTQWQRRTIPKCNDYRRGNTDAALWIMHKNTFFNPSQRWCSDAIKLQRRSTAAVMTIVTILHNITPTLRSYSVGVPTL